MAASITDKWNQGTASTRPVPTTLTATRSIGDGTITCGALTGWPTSTAVHFIIYTVDTSGNKVAGSQTDWKGIVSGTTITGLVLKAGSDAGDSIGAIVECGPTAAWANDIVAGAIVDHDQLGQHKTLTDANGNEWIKQTATASAVNELTVANAATGNSPILSATGGDTNVGLTLTPKGTGNISMTSRADGWVTGLTAPNTVTANGNRSYDMVFNTLDYTDRLSPGMRLKLTRTVTAPTQCTSLNGTTQYYSKATPNKFSWTDDFTVSAWIKLSSYPAAGNGIASCFNNTSGWILQTTASGTIQLSGFNGGAGNVSYVGSYQSVPLNKWVHVAAQLDMSAFTATTTTSYIMIDGVDVPASVTRAGTNPTALVQAGNLNIGAWNGGTAPFTGKIAQVAIYNAKVPQATILASMHQTLSGSETSLASAYSFNNSITDLNTTTPNDLTAQGSAVATNADSPFALDAQGVPVGTTEYAVITKTAFSTNTTLTVQVPEGNAIPTSGGVSALSYSTQAVPLGFISARGKWRVTYLDRAQRVSVSNATYAAYPGMSFIVPTGDWLVGYDIGLYNQTTTDVGWCLSSSSQTGLSISTADTTLSSRVTSPALATTTNQNYIFYNYRHSTATTYTMYQIGATTSAGTLGSSTRFEFFAECAYI